MLRSHLPKGRAQQPPDSRELYHSNKKHPKRGSERVVVGYSGLGGMFYRRYINHQVAYLTIKVATQLIKCHNADLIHILISHLGKRVSRYLSLGCYISVGNSPSLSGLLFLNHCFQSELHGHATPFYRIYLLYHTRWYDVKTLFQNRDTKHLTQYLKYDKLYHKIETKTV